MPMTPPLINSDRFNVVLYCQQWADTVHFYTHILHLPVVFQNDWFVEFQLLPHTFLSIAQAERATISAVNGQGITLTLHVDDIHTSHAKLTQQNITPTPIKNRWGSNVFYCHDPEGHRLEFWSEKHPNE